MSVSTPPPAPPKKKRGWGCCGCGCFILALLVILFLGLIGAGSYVFYTKILELTSPTAANIQSFDGGDDMYNTARQKVIDFDHDLKDHQAATIDLNADEINTLIARDPDFAKNNIHVFVTFSGNSGRLQASLPTPLLTYGMIRGRYANGETSFGLSFDTPSRSIEFMPQTFIMGDRTLLDQNSNDEQTASDAAFKQSFMQSFNPIFNQSFNNAIRQNPDGKALLDQAKSVEIKDGELVIETQ